MPRVIAESVLGCLRRWGFAFLVVFSTAVAIAAALVSPVPVEVPDFALRAGAVYRLEVGVAFFATLYLAATAFVLALHNRAFTEFGSSRVSAHALSEEKQESIEEDLEANLALIWRLLATKSSSGVSDNE